MMISLAGSSVSGAQMAPLVGSTMASSMVATRERMPPTPTISNISYREIFRGIFISHTRSSSVTETNTDRQIIR